MKRVRAGWIAGALVATLAASVQAADEKPGAPPTISAGQDGFILQSGDGAFRLRVTGYAQADGRFFAGDEDELGTNAFLLRRVRPIVSGNLGKIFEFNITPDFGGGAAVVQDAYLDARHSAKARLRFGKFKVPFGLERLQSASGLFFVERGLPSSLAHIRDVGVQLHGELGGGIAFYAVGLFNGAVDGSSADTDTNDGKDLGGRVFFQPFRKSAATSARGIGIGVAATTGRQEGALPSFRSPGQLTFFAYASGVTAGGTRTRVMPQASYSEGPFRLITEYARSRQEVTKGRETSEVTHAAWQAAGTFLLTGETPAAGVVSPKRPFGTDKGWGAFELAARYTELDVDDDAFARGLADPARSASKATAVAFGLNWYLTKNVKYVANYERTRFEGGRAGGDRESENALLFRVQLAY